MNILGVSALYHDAAAALIMDGEIIAAAQEERFTRKKHDFSIPENAIAYCLEEGKIKSDELNYVVFYEDPFLVLDRYMKNIGTVGKESQDLIKTGSFRMFSQVLWIKDYLKNIIPSIDNGTEFRVTKHHIAHAASAFYPSPFRKSLILTMDGVGEWTTLSIGVGEENRLEIKEELKYPHSLGLVYSAFTYFCGFKVNSGDYKFMGLAPYGKPVYYDLICREIINIKNDGSFRLNLDYFDYQNGRTMINEGRMSSLFGGSRRLPESMITEREMNIAASVQKVTEDIVIRIARHGKEAYGNNIDNLTMAGGVALNCVANGKLVEEEIYRNIWIQPAAGDAGGALGAALYLYYHELQNERRADGDHDMQKGSYLGPAYKDKEIEEVLKRKQAIYHHQEKVPYEHIASLLDRQKVIGLFEGRMEYGPRALGNRSIIADSRDENMQARMNLKTKFRESFRPFAPAVLKEDAGCYFDLGCESPYMLLCGKVKENCRSAFELERCLAQSKGDMTGVIKTRRSEIPAVTHVDYSARIQTVDGRYNRDFYEILSAFKKLTGCGVLINTSFNVRGEPIVCTPEDAWLCFMRTDMDVLVIGNYILYKEEQPSFEDKDWRKQYELD